LVAPAWYSDYNNPDVFGEDTHVHLSDITPEPYVSVGETAPPENVGLECGVCGNHEGY